MINEKNIYLIKKKLSTEGKGQGKVIVKIIN